MSDTPRTDAVINELEKLWEDASGRAEYVSVEMIAMDARDLAAELRGLTAKISEITRERDQLRGCVGRLQREVDMLLLHEGED